MGRPSHAELRLRRAAELSESERLAKLDLQAEHAQLMQVYAALQQRMSKLETQVIALQNRLVRHEQRSAR